MCAVVRKSLESGTVVMRRGGARSGVPACIIDLGGARAANFCTLLPNAASILPALAALQGRGGDKHMHGGHHGAHMRGGHHGAHMHGGHHGAHMRGGHHGAHMHGGHHGAHMRGGCTNRRHPFCSDAGARSVQRHLSEAPVLFRRIVCRSRHVHESAVCRKAARLPAPSLEQLRGRARGPERRRSCSEQRGLTRRLSPACALACQDRARACCAAGAGNSAARALTSACLHASWPGQSTCLRTCVLCCAAGGGNSAARAWTSACWTATARLAGTLHANCSGRATSSTGEPLHTRLGPGCWRSTVGCSSRAAISTGQPAKFGR